MGSGVSTNVCMLHYKLSDVLFVTFDLSDNLLFLTVCSFSLIFSVTLDRNIFTILMKDSYKWGQIECHLYNVLQEIYKHHNQPLDSVEVLKERNGLTSLNYKHCWSHVTETKSFKMLKLWLFCPFDPQWVKQKCRGFTWEVGCNATMVHVQIHKLSWLNQCVWSVLLIQWYLSPSKQREGFVLPSCHQSKYGWH